MGFSRRFYLPLLFLCFVLTQGELWASENLDLAVSADAVFVNGQINELVYPSAASQNTYLSTLEWEIGNVFFIGPRLRIGFLDKFSFGLSVYGNLNIGSGAMRNSDWKNPRSGSPSHFSESRIIMDSFTSWRLDGTFYCRIAALSNFSFHAGLGFKFYRWNFQDRLVSYRYPKRLQGTLDKYIGGNTVSYSANYFFPQVVVAGEFEYAWFRTRLNLRYGFLGYIDAVDEHSVRGVRYRDRIFPAHHLGANLSLWFRLSKPVYIRLDVNFGTVLEVRGYTVIEKPEVHRYRIQPNPSGGSGRWFDIGIGVEWRFLPSPAPPP